MQVNAEIKVTANSDEKAEKLVEKIKSFFTENVGEDANIQCQVFNVDIPTTLKEAKQSAGFTDGGDVDMIETLLEEFELNTARFVFKAGQSDLYGSRWEYWLVTGHGLEYIGSLQEHFTELGLPEKYDGLPKALPLLLFFGKDPNDGVLEMFRSGQYVWHTLRSDVDIEKLYTQEGLETLWQDIHAANPLFEPAELVPLASEIDSYVEVKSKMQVPDSIYRLMATGLTNTLFR